MHQGTRYLRVKIKSLAVEAGIIRHEERQTRGGNKRALQDHRKGVVRFESRAACLAYGFVRGVPYNKIEPWTRTRPPIDRVAALVKKYGAGGLSNPGELEDWFGEEIVKMSPYEVRPKRHDNNHTDSPT